MSNKVAQYDKEISGWNGGKSGLELVIEGFKGTDSFRSGGGWVGGSIHSHNSHVGHVAFQTVWPSSSVLMPRLRGMLQDVCFNYCLNVY